VDATIAGGGHALIHCHASLSRSVAFILAYLMRSRGLSLLGAAQLMCASPNARAVPPQPTSSRPSGPARMQGRWAQPNPRPNPRPNPLPTYYPTNLVRRKPKWDALWPCDRFVDQLIVYEASAPTAPTVAHHAALVDGCWLLAACRSFHPMSRAIDHPVAPGCVPDRHVSPRPTAFPPALSPLCAWATCSSERRPHMRFGAPEEGEVAPVRRTCARRVRVSVAVRAAYDFACEECRAGPCTRPRVRGTRARTRR
jgi:hypothetical protein